MLIGMGDATALTPKETEVLDLVRERLTNREIARRLFVSERTVESHVASILRKMQVPNRRALAKPLVVPQAGNLPARLTSFVGREAEMAQLDEMLADRRIVTLIGPAGAGKTRLATEIAARVAPRCPDGAWFVDLASVTTDHGVAEKVLAVLGGRQSPGRSAQDTLSGIVRDRTYLVVLDNCEHLLAGAAWVAGVLASGSPDIRVVATSRIPLELGGEVVFPVPPLATAETEADASDNDAVRLLVDRARDAGASVDLDEDAATILRLCRRLDGLPLALELIAPRLRAFTPSHLIDLLDHRFDLLASSGAGRPRRHHTLRAAIEWSYDLLDADERELFGRLSVFAGSFELDAAAEVCADERLSRTRILEHLPRLVDRSLVVVEPGHGMHRYRLLESLREFAAEQLDPDTARAGFDRHAAFYLNLAESAAPKLHGADGSVVRDRLRLDHDQLLHALDWSSQQAPDRAVRLVATLCDFWALADVACTGIDWADRVLALDAGAPEDRVRALIGATSLTSAADVTAAQRYGRAALDLARDMDDAALIAQAEAALVEPHAYVGDAELAGKFADDAIRYFAAHDDAWSVANVQVGLSFIKRGSEALELLTGALDTLSAAGDLQRAANVHYILADRYLRELGDPDAAQPHAEQARDLALDAHSVHERTHAESILAEIAMHHGNLDAAADEAGRCLDVFERLGDHRCVTAMTLTLAMCAAGRGDDDAALRLIRSVIGFVSRAAQARTIPLALDLAASLLAERAPDTALVLATAADARAGSFGVGIRPHRIDPKRLSVQGEPAHVPDTLADIAAVLDAALPAIA
jgi:predicted ATPase/DNA-binding CsgD family transcriptional regulator